MPWRGPEHPDDFPSLGWALLDWWADHLPSPRDPSAPLIFTDEQARQLVEWYRIDPRTGRYVYRRGYSRRAKGWGKSPVEAAKAIAEFAGPVRFDGWGANGEPVGRPWGRAGDPRAWVQIGAISEDQTDNTWAVVYYLLTENDGKAADALGIDAGLTRCFLRGQPGAKLEPVTAAAGSREGQPITYGVIDESHLMLPGNGGRKLAATIRRNVAKMNGRSYETTNSFVVGLGSVAELSYRDVRKGAPDIFADETEAPRQVDGVGVGEAAPDDVMTAALRVAYGDSYWVDIPRLVAEARDGSMEWVDVERFFLNWNVNADHGWTVIPKGAWQACAVDIDKDAEPLTNVHAALHVADGQTHATLAAAGRRANDERLQCENVRTEQGTEWVVEACRNAVADTGSPVVIDPRTPTSGVIEQLKSAGVPLREVSTAEFVAACSALQNEVTTGRMVHFDDRLLTAAVRNVGTKRHGESWAFAASKSSVDITPLIAVTLATIPAREAPRPAADVFVGFIEL